MHNDSPDLTRVLHSAAWIWLGYLAALVGIDIYMYASIPRPLLWEYYLGMRGYYLANAMIALVFLGCSYWPWLQRTLKGLYVPLILVIISGLPIVASRLDMPRLPPGPMSNIEGITLRLLPVLFIGLVIAAWQYPWPIVAVFSAATAGLEIGILMLLPQPEDPSATYAVVFVAIVRSVSFLVVGYFISRLMQRLKTQQQQLAQANARLIHYASTLEQLTVSRERNRISRELHDTVVHTLSGLSVQLETARAYWSINPGTARNLVDQALEAVRSGLKETRRAIKSLRASPLEDLGLAGAMRHLIQTSAQRGQLTADISLPDPDLVLSPDVQQGIYRIAQEAIDNVLHHAGARNLAVRLAVDDEDVVLLVQDDGTGFNPQAAPPPGHFGIAGMRERAELVGGDLTIHTQPGRGTTVQLIMKGSLG